MAAGWTALLPGTLEGSLATDGTRLFAVTADGTVRALSRLSGAILWEVKGRRGLLAASADALVVREADGTLWGMNPETGAARWKVETAIEGSLAPQFLRDLVIVAGKGMAAVRTADGSALWTSTDGIAASAPVGSGPYVLVGETDGTLRGRDSATGTTLWTFPTAGALVNTPFVDDAGRIFLGTTDRRLLTLRLDKGSKAWTWKVGADVHRTPVALGRLVLFTSQEDVLYALKRSNGHLVWRSSLPSRPISGPMLHRGAALVACQGARPGETLVVGFDGQTGRRLGDLKAPGEVQSAPLVLDDHLVMPFRSETNPQGETRSSVVSMLMGVPPSPTPEPTPTPTPTPTPAPSPSLTTQ
jgi:outer membrane protein assembly factor BamB